jgi:hypothetical protein
MLINTLHRNFGKPWLTLPYYAVGIFQVETSFVSLKLNLLFAYAKLKNTPGHSLSYSKASDRENGCRIHVGHKKAWNKIYSILNAYTVTVLGHATHYSLKDDCF